MARLGEPSQRAFHQYVCAVTIRNHAFSPGDRRQFRSSAYSAISTAAAKTRRAIHQRCVRQDQRRRPEYLQLIHTLTLQITAHFINHLFVVGFIESNLPTPQQIHGFRTCCGDPPMVPPSRRRPLPCECRNRRIIARRISRSLSSVCGIKDWSPKPGFTDISRITSSLSMTYHN